MDKKPTYEELEAENKRLKETIAAMYDEDSLVELANLIRQYPKEPVLWLFQRVFGEQESSQ